MINYYIMAKQFATFTGAAYDDDKLVLSGTRPDFYGHVVDWSQRTLEDLDELLADTETMRATPPQGFLLIIPRWFGSYLHQNHPAFKPKQTEEI
jgi:hypothetical protein